MVQVYAALSACGITLLEHSFIAGFKLIKTVTLLRRTFPPTQLVLTTYSCFPFSLHTLTGVNMDPTSSAVARNTNVNAKEGTEACRQDRRKGRTEEPHGSTSFACLNPKDCSSTLSLSRLEHFPAGSVP